MQAESGVPKGDSERSYLIYTTAIFPNFSGSPTNMIKKYTGY